MTDWPNDQAVLWLSVGIACLLWSLWRIARRGLGELLALDVIFIWTMWTGYHLTPWLAMENGGWSGFLLVPEHVDAGIRNASFAMLAFIVGYAFASSGRQAATSQPPTFTNKHVVAIVLLSLVVIIGTAAARGGFTNLFFDVNPRGAGQWQERGFIEKILHNIRVLSTAASIILCILSSWILTHTKSRSFFCYTICLLGIFISSFPLMVKFSRASGGSLFILAMFFLANPYRRRFLACTATAVLGLHLCWVGYTARKDYNPGVGNMLIAAIERPLAAVGNASDGGAMIKQDDHKSEFDPSRDNFLNALDPWTLRAETAINYDGNTFERFFLLVSVLQPLPSEWSSLPARVGPSLSVVRGTTGHTGLTTPALAELYYLFGQFGAIFFLIYGYFGALVDGRYRARGDVRFLILKLLIAAGFVVGLHSGLRAMTRFPLYTLVALILLPRLVRQRRTSDVSRESLF